MEGGTTRDMMITFVSTHELRKKKGRESVTAQALEVQHEELMQQRRLVVQSKLKLEKVQYLEMTTKERKELSEKVPLFYLRYS